MAGLAPGVRIVEKPSGSRTIAGVSTSDTIFVGMAERGPLDTPIRIFNQLDFERTFGEATNGDLATQIQMFYLNGGGAAWVVRIAESAVQSTVTLDDADGNPRLAVTAIDAGILGDSLRVVVDYATASPERTFNLTVFRTELQVDGTTTESENETFTNLSMDPASPRFVDTVINGTSPLITVEADVTTLPVVPEGVAFGGRVFSSTAATAQAEINAALAAGGRIRVAINNNPAVEVTLPTLVTNLGDLADWGAAIEQRYLGQGVTVDCTVTGVTGADSVTGGRMIRFTSTSGAIEISAAAAGDAAVALGLGVAAGGIEGDAFGAVRPAANGLVSTGGDVSDDFAALRTFAGRTRTDLTNLQLTDTSGDGPHNFGAGLSTNAAADRMYDFGSPAQASLGGVRLALDEIAALLNDNTNDRWTFRRVGYRLVGTPTFGGDTGSVGAALTSTAANILADLFANAGVNARTPLAGGFDGNAPTNAEYVDAFDAIERQVELFSLMVLVENAGQSREVLDEAYRTASAFCARRKAFLLVDPPASWTTASLAEDGVDALRIGMATENASVRWPRLAVSGRGPVGPSGSVAGLMARIDSSRGVWKAAAGYEATIRGVTGLERQITDAENGILNPKALNAMRVFPPGVVSWGARTLAGADELANDFNKFEPVRRTTLFIEQSLERGLGFAVFEPNDEPLWAQIRLAAGAFMNGLFRQGAFAGSTTRDSYFVSCDSTTTTPTDQNLGIVNVVVGFAPLKPAEFVVVTITHVTQALSV